MKLCDTLNYANNNAQFITDDYCINELWRGTVYEENGEYTKAFYVFNEIIECKKGSPLVNGIAYCKMAKICMDSVNIGNHIHYYLLADSIFINILDSDEKLYYYKLLINDVDTQKNCFLPMKIADDAIQFCKLNKEWKTYIKYKYGLIFYYRNNGKYDKALQMYNKLLSFLRKQGRTKVEAHLLNFSYELYQPINDSLRILRDLTRALELSNELNDDRIKANVFNNFGRYYSSQKKYEISNESYKAAAALNLILNDKNGLAINFLNIGSGYSQLQKIDSAIVYFNKSIVLNTEIGFEIGNGFCYSGLLRIANRENDEVNSIRYAKLAKEAAEKCDYHRVKSGLYPILIDFYRRMGEKDSVIYYMSKNQKLTDSISSVEIHNNMQKYESSMKEREIALLKLEHDIQLVNNKKNNVILMLLILLVAIAIISLVVISLFYSRKKKAYSKLVEKNMQLIKIKESHKTLQNNKQQHTATEDVELYEKFIKLLRVDKLYRNHDVTIEYFAELLNTNRSYLSKAINNTTNKNFKYLVNEFRIQESCKMLVDSEYNNLSIEGIASTVGFSSKASFNRVFKTQTNLTPSDFRNNKNLVDSNY